MAHKWKPRPHLPNGELNWKAIEIERRERNSRMWSQLMEQRINPQRYPLAKIPVVARAYKR